MASKHAPLVLIVRDGWGQNPHPEHDPFNAVHLAKTPIADQLDGAWPRALIHTCCRDVGLPADTMGNSEVGHQNIGAGRIVPQELMRLNKAVEDGSFAQVDAFLEAFEHVSKTSGRLHLIGLVSDGSVHSHINHLYALIDLAKKQQLAADRLVVHAITDGRDVGPTSGRGFIEGLENKLSEAKVGRIGTVMGRFYAMDRDNRWEREARAYEALTGHQVAYKDLDQVPEIRQESTAAEAVSWYYENPTDQNRHGDEFIVPTQIVDTSGKPIGLIENGDAVIFFNYRGDRPRELTKAFTFDEARFHKEPGGGFDRGGLISNLYFCTMTGYESGLPVVIAFSKPPTMPDILGQVIADAGLTQFRCAETEKFPHVTFFFNDYQEELYAGESRYLAQSPKDVSTYDQKPEMSAYEVRDAVLEQIASEKCPALIVVNFANGDMVGHTGNLEAAIKAIEVVDACVGEIVEATLQQGGSLIVTADHGNAEQMRMDDGVSPHTKHTTYEVPLYIIGEAFKDMKLREGGRLADVAPTVLFMMNIDPPKAMTGQSILETD
ncbi:MAG: 2,3-bisphosphoglycerate-independent phosphoglycerate mutase [Phycisphaerales bacterium]|nr:2,3-bisphosphoglycerate-independent phosphoglycerate mutase [Phycisphaerales bacterium]